MFWPSWGLIWKFQKRIVIKMDRKQRQDMTRWRICHELISIDSSNVTRMILICLILKFLLLNKFQSDDDNNAADDDDGGGGGGELDNMAVIASK